MIIGTCGNLIYCIFTKNLYLHDMIHFVHCCTFFSSSILSKSFVFKWRSLNFRSLARSDGGMSSSWSIKGFTCSQTSTNSGNFTVDFPFPPPPPPALMYSFTYTMSKGLCTSYSGGWGGGGGLLQFISWPLKHVGLYCDKQHCTYPRIKPWTIFFFLIPPTPPHLFSTHLLKGVCVTGAAEKNHSWVINI